MEREELAAWLRLTLSPGVGNATARKLLAAFGLPHVIFQQSSAALRQVVTERQALGLAVAPPELQALLDTTWNWLTVGHNPMASGALEGETPQAQEQHDILVLGDAAYPKSLLNIEDPPLMLYVLSVGKGRVADRLVDCLSHSIAIVGSRNPTPQGAIHAHQFARALSAAGLTVVSGLALGVDGAAHQGAIDGAPNNDTGENSMATIAVVGTGLDRVYPKSHRTLAHAIARNGLVVSEYLLGTPPLAENFPRRNRIIAGLAQGTLVVEAALKSGSLITARLAAEQGKEVFAIPGSIQSIQSRGCHSLIRQGAKLVETVQDILEELKFDIPTPQGADGENAEGIDDFEDDNAVDDDDALITALGYDPVSLDTLQARTGIPTPQLQAQLMTLEIEEKVSRLPGGLFQRIASA